MIEITRLADEDLLTQESIEAANLAEIFGKLYGIDPSSVDSERKFEDEMGESLADLALEAVKDS